MFSFQTPNLITSLQPLPQNDSLLEADVNGNPIWISRPLIYGFQINTVSKSIVRFNLDCSILGCQQVQYDNTVYALKDLSEYCVPVSFGSSALFQNSYKTDENGRLYIDINSGGFISTPMSVFNVKSQPYGITCYIIWRRRGTEATSTIHTFLNSDDNTFKVTACESDGFYTITYNGNTYTTSAGTYSKQHDWTITTISYYPNAGSYSLLGIRQNGVELYYNATVNNNGGNADNFRTNSSNMQYCCPNGYGSQLDCHYMNITVLNLTPSAKTLVHDVELSLMLNAGRYTIMS